jgi:hypothetical protein
VCVCGGGGVETVLYLRKVLIRGIVIDTL